ncbi:MAG: hypothetical protein A2W25_16315 [candidate division Zixibacteria bacterium RBG_16_53_22]|nr:MAG: hypothetical protein A2W25_16315 [candidate division Zixibacteria bacterium RBG_16_53_22]
MTQNPVASTSDIAPLSQKDREFLASKGLSAPTEPGFILQGGENCSDYFDLGSALPTSDAGTTTGRVNNYGPYGTLPACWPGYFSGTSSGAGPDVTYKWTAPSAGLYNFSLCGSSYDTGLEIYNFTCPTEPTIADLICGNDDQCGLQSELTNISLTAGQAVLIVVDGWGSSNGAYTLNITETPTCVPDFTVTAPGSWSGSTVGAGDDCSLRLGEDHIYEVIIPYEADWEFSFCGGPSSWDAYLYLGTLCCFGDLGYNDDGCTGANEMMPILAQHLVAGTYYVDFEPYSSGYTGDYTFTVSEVVPCVVTIPPGATMETEDNGGCNSIPPAFPDTIVCGETVAGTGWFDGATRDTDWFIFTLTSNKDVTITATAEFPYLAGIIVPFSSDPCDNSGSLTYYILGGACDTLSVTGFLAGPGPGVYVAFFAPQFSAPFTTGDYWMSMTCADPAPCIPDLQITAPGTWSGTTCGMLDDNYNTCLGSYDEGEDFVYEVILPIDTTIEITLDPLGTTYTGIAIATECEMLNCIAFDNEWQGIPHSIPPLDLTAGTYYIMVDTWPLPDCIPSFNLSITYSVPCVALCPPGGIQETEDNGGCNSVPYAFPDTIQCGETVCGTGWFDGSTRDTDWFLFNVTENSYVTLTATAEFDWIAGLIKPLSADPCDNTGYFDYYVTGGPCDTLSVTGEFYVPGPGIYIAFFAPQFTTVFTDAPYWMTMTCEHLPSPGFSVNPPAVSGQADTGGVDTELLTVSNTGDADLTADVSISINPPAMPSILPPVGNDPMASLRVNEVERVPSNIIPSAPDPNVILQGGDNIGSATPITALPYNDVGTTSGYFDDYNEICPYDYTGAPDVVYSFVATVDSVLTITLCNGSLYDTKLYVYENTVGNVVGCNDDACPGWVSELSANYNAPVTVIAGNTYYIVVDGYDSFSYGSYVIDVDYAVPPPPPPGCPDTGVLLGANPTLPSESWAFNTSDTELGYTVFESFAGVFGTIEEIHFWGLDLICCWTECDEDPADFEIGFYQDSSGYPGPQVGLYNVTVSPVALGNFIGYTQKGYVATITPPMVMSQGWFSIKNTTIDACSFLWQNSLFGSDGNSWQYNDNLGTWAATFDDQAFCFVGTYQEPWLSVDVTSIFVPPAGTAPVNVTMDAADLAIGTYTGDVVFNTNELGATVHTVPVTFDVTGGGGGCTYIPGDINNFGGPNGIDVTYGVAYLKGGSYPPVDCNPPCAVGDTVFFAAMDVNGTCSTNGIDITYFVAYLKQLQPALLYCDDCPPAGLAAPGAGQDRPAIVPIKKAMSNQQ